MREIRRKKSRGEGNPIWIPERELDCVAVFTTKLKLMKFSAKVILELHQ